MTLIDWLALGGGATAVLGINWYFFGAERVGPAAAAHGPAHGPLEATITVQGGYAPAVVRATAGRPVRLVFDRQETSGCSEEVVFPDFGLRRYLPAYAQTVIELTPPAPGTYAFTCGMGMLRGRLVAE